MACKGNECVVGNPQHPADGQGATTPIDFFLYSGHGERLTIITIVDISLGFGCQLTAGLHSEGGPPIAMTLPERFMMNYFCSVICRDI
jgi:hypothetical protein